MWLPSLPRCHQKKYQFPVTQNHTPNTAIIHHHDIWVLSTSGEIHKCNIERGANQSCCYKKGIFHGGKSNSGCDCKIGWEMGVDIQPHIPKLILFGTFAQTLSQLPPLFLVPELAAWWRWFYSLLGPKGCFHRPVIAFGTINRLAWNKGHRTMFTCNGRRREREFINPH